MPAPLADRVRAELPAGWGLLAVAHEGKPQVVVKPQRHEPKLLTDGWRTDAVEIGEAVNAITDWRRRPKDVVASTLRQAEMLARHADEVKTLASTLAEVLAPQALGAAGGRSPEVTAS